MATTVNSAFDEFMKDIVNLDSERVKIARNSRDNLIDNIESFGGDGDFFNIYEEKKMNFGSFARRTKIRELDDIDLMVCFSGDGRTYLEGTDCFYITGNDSDKTNNLMTNLTTNLNSTKVTNRLIAKLKTLNDYKKAEIHKNHEAATLQLKSYEWNFDIVPCFFTTGDFYLIPDGKGNWKKTDPRIDNQRTININQKHNGNLLNLIRLVKYWNNRKVTLKIDSYFLESMVLSIYENKKSKDSWWIDLEFRDLMLSLSNTILNDFDDPKGIQGNLNAFSNEERKNISSVLKNIYCKASEAVKLEINDKKQKEAIDKWGEIFGDKFPVYEED